MQRPRTGEPRARRRIFLARDRPLQLKALLAEDGGARPYANLSDLLLRKQKAKQQSIIVPCLAAMKCFYMAA